MNYKKRENTSCFYSEFWKTLRIFTPLVIIFLLNTSTVFAQGEQTITVSGNIKDVSNEPIIGASIKVENSTTGTITDFNGNFTLKAPANANLLISYVGYASQKSKVSSTPISIILQEDAAKLDEVVVIGYGQVKRANLTGAVSSIAMKEVQDFPAPNLATVLSGRMPGVHISEPTGNVIGSASITVRINGSFATTGYPLYVIDGFIRDVDAFNRLDPSEVESVSVLKDASAAVYGVRGANGVILVATKRGVTGKPKISYAASYGISQGVKMPEMMSAYEQGVALNDLWNQEITYKHADPTNYTMFSDAELEKMKTLDYNWIDMAWKNANNTRHTLNVSGGSETIKYFIGGSYMFADGNFPGLSMNRYGIRFGIDANFTKNLKGSFSMDYTEKQTNSPYNSSDTEPDRMYGTFSELTRTPRYIPPYINGIPVNYDNVSTGVHPLEIFNSGSYRRSNSNDAVTSMSLEYTIPQMKELKLSITANYSKSSGNGKQLSKPYYLYRFYKDTEFPHLLTDVQYPISDATYRKKITNGDKIYESASFGYRYQFDPQISYAKKFGKNDISAMLIYEQAEGGGNGLSESRQTMIIDNYEIMDGYATADQVTSSNINTLSRRQSFIGRLNYIFDDKYIIESSGRYEASTMFAPEYRWAFFPSVSAGWRISEEPFFKDNVKFMNNLKIRLSAGRLGNDDASSNQWRTSYIRNGSTLIGGGVSTLNLKPQNGGLVYYNATWENSDFYNAGLDMTFFNELNVNVDAFYKHTTDILNMPTSTFPQSSGITGTIPRLNFGIQNAWGTELGIEYNKKVNKDLTLQVRGNLAYSMNRVINKFQNPGVIGTWADENGKVAGGEVGYDCLGLARSQTDIDNYIAYLQANYLSYHGTTGAVTALGIGETDMKPGMLMYKDVGSAAYQDADGHWHDGAPDGIVDSNDQRIISKYSFNPYEYSFSFGVNWKSLSINALFSGSFGSNVIFEKGFWTDASGGGRTGAFLSLYSNQLKEWYGNYWTENNVDAKYPRLDTWSLRGNRSTFWMRNGHELHFKTINISYTLPAKLIKHMGLEQCRVYFQGSNLWTIINPYPYKDASVGFWSDYPMIRTYNLGLNLSL